MDFPVTVRPVRTSSDERVFIRFQWKIYDPLYPNWVPPLLADRKKLIDRKNNPFYRHARMDAAVRALRAPGSTTTSIASTPSRTNS